MSFVPELPELTTPASDDVFEIVDVSDTSDGASGTSKKLALSNLGTGSGSSFPSTPYTGQQYFRSDLGLWCYYDGTYWLTAMEYSIPLAETTLSANNTLINPTWIGNTYQPYFTTQKIRTYVATTNTGSHYWTVTVRSRAVDGSTNHTMTSINTSADSANVNVDHSEAADTPVPATYYGLPYFAAEKTGTPGNLTLTGTIKYRWIIPS